MERLHHRRPKHLLSGLCKCGACGGSYVVTGPKQLGCSTRREKGTCENRRMISSRLVETRVIEALEQHLLHPDVLERVASLAPISPSAGGSAAMRIAY